MNKESSKLRVTPNPKRPKNLSPQAAQHFSGQDSGRQPKVFVKTFGCQMNVRDSEVICGILDKAGFEIAGDQTVAEIVILNTCSVRQHAEDKVWSEIGSFKGRKIIGLVGCMAQNYKELIFQRCPDVDFVVGPSDIDKIPRIIEELTKSQNKNASGNNLLTKKIWETEGNCRPEEIYHTGFYEDKEHAYVVISEGCSNFCSYCVVPYVRGALRNRDYRNILKEIKAAVREGITHITLLGQNVNAYKYEEIDFIRLLGLVNSEDGLNQFSFITSHPKDTTVDLFKAMAQLDKLKKSLHLPAQSGSDRILALMNRGYTRKFYLDLADNYRKIVKDASLTTDIIVGFPTETEEDFRETYDLLEKTEFDAAYIFKYSTRPHTESEKMVDNIAKEEKERRHQLVLDLQKSISRKKKVKE